MDAHRRCSQQIHIACRQDAHRQRCPRTRCGRGRAMGSRKGTIALSHHGEARRALPKGADGAHSERQSTARQPRPSRATGHIAGEGRRGWERCGRLRGPIGCGKPHSRRLSRAEEERQNWSALKRPTASSSEVPSRAGEKRGGQKAGRNQLQRRAPATTELTQKGRCA